MLTTDRITTDRVTAVFDSRAEAERAITALRQAGVIDTQLSVVTRDEGSTAVSGSGSVAGDTAASTGTGALVGGSVGALFGLAAAAIPGVGPFISAGWLASTLGVTGGAAAAGAVVGGTSGALAGLFTNAGYDENEATYYGGAVDRGAVVVAVDTRSSAIAADQVRALLNGYGGRTTYGQS